MRQAGAVVARVLSRLTEMAKPGVSTGELDRLASRMTAEAGAEPLFKGVRGPRGVRPFPGVICASINQEVVHGIPSDHRVLKEGDILSLDFGVRLNGYCGDAAVTLGIGRIGPLQQRLIDVTEEALNLAIKHMRPQVRWSQIADMMQRHVEQAGFSVVRQFVGHGIGTKMHEDPKVPNFVSKDLLEDDIVLTEGMVLAVEPMVNAGTHEVTTLSNGWTVVTSDGQCSAHFEHTIAVTASSCEVLTLDRCPR
jgi:methionyl aminopeptidase